MNWHRFRGLMTLPPAVPMARVLETSWLIRVLQRVAVSDRGATSIYDHQETH